jgi:hypothetical protein
MTQDCAFDVRHLGFGRAPASPPRDRAFAMPITGLGLTLRAPTTQEAIYHTPEHFHGVAGMPAGVGQPGGWREVTPGGTNLTPEPRSSGGGPRGNIGSGGTSSGSASNVGGEGGGRLGPAAGSSGPSEELSAGNEGLFPRGAVYHTPGHFQGINGLPTGVGQEGAFAQDATRLVRGLGQVSTITTFTPLVTCPNGSSWVSLPSTNSFHGYSYAQVVANLNSYLTSGGGAVAADSRLYFTLGGGASLRYNPSTGVISRCTVNTAVVPVSPPVVPVAAGGAAVVGVAFSSTGASQVQYSANPLGPAFFALPLPPNAPAPGVPTFVTAPGLGQFSWVLVTPTPGSRPNAPPPGVTLPGVWALVRPHFWMWYPSPPRTLAVVNTYFVFTNSDQLLGVPNPGLPRPTAPPPQLAGTAAGVGQWINSGPGYWAWAPTMTVVPTSYAWLWALLLLGGAGVGAYYLLD